MAGRIGGEFVLPPVGHCMREGILMMEETGLQILRTPISRSRVSNKASGFRGKHICLSAHWCLCELPSSASSA